MSWANFVTSTQPRPIYPLDHFASFASNKRVDDIRPWSELIYIRQGGFNPSLVVDVDVVSTTYICSKAGTHEGQASHW